MASLTFKPVTGTKYLYIADCGGGLPPAGSPQVGYFLPASTQNPPTQISLAESWQDYQGYYIFLDEGLTDPALFVESLVQYLSGIQGRAFLWIENPNDTSDPLIVTPLRFSSSQSTAAPATFAFRNNTVVIGAGCAITVDTTANQFAIAQSSTDSIYVQVDWGATILDNAVGQTLYVPLCGATSGCLQFQVTLSETYLDGNHLDAGFRYFIDDTQNPRPGFLVSARYPMLSLGTGNVGMMANLDPLGATNQSRTYFSFTGLAGGGNPEATPVGSYFRTNTGQAVTLTPTDSALFVFAPNPANLEPDPNDPLYLVPSGDFVMSSPNGAAASKTAAPKTGGASPTAAHGPRLICGLGGNEYFDLITPSGQSNIISFSPGGNAYIPGFGAQANGAKLGQPEPSATTSWATMKPASSANSVNYYAQPQTAELFAQGFPSGTTLSSNRQVEAEAAQLLGFLEVPALGFQQPTPVFPMAPYAGIQPDVVPLDTILQIETQVLSPYRRNEFGFSTGSVAKAEALTEAPAPNSTTPQGFLANVGAGGGAGEWTSLVLGQSDTGGQLVVNVASSAQLQPALQTNKQFIVVTQINALSFFNTQNQISIGGWTFSFGVTAAPPQGEYYNVIIFKYYNDSIKDLAANTSLWTNANIFNNNDPDAAAKWLQGYISDAEDQVAKGNTLFQSFVELVNDTNWNGILGLNVYIPPGELPTEVQGLLGGMDLTKFSAHHFGVETNSVGSDFSLTKSSLFALINYDNTSGGKSTATDAGATSAGAADSSLYDFKVLTLQVAFANSEIVNFNSQIQVTINNLFDTPANLESAPQGSPQDSGNAIILQGSYESHNGASTYSFTASGSYVFNLDSELLKSVTLTKVQFTTVATDTQGGSDLITSSFAFWGSLTFGTLADFDFFSFDDLAFADLSLSFTFNPNDVGPDRIPIQSFTFDPGNLRFDISISKARQDSLLGSFPLRLTGFTYTSAGVSVSDLGYLQIASPINNLSGPVIYALGFELDLGSIGGLSSPLKGFSADFVAGWNPHSQYAGQVALGIKMPESSGGKLQIGIEGVLLLTIQNFEFTTLAANGDIPQRYVLFMRGCTLQVLGTTVPPGGNFSFVFFAPTGESIRDTLANLGWFVAYQANSSNDAAKNGAARQLAGASRNGNGDGGGSSIITLSYLGLGQRIQFPDGLDDANTVSAVLEAMQEQITPDLTGDKLNEQLAKIYNPSNDWLVGGQFTILDTITLGAVFYDPNLYGVMLGIAKGKLGPLGGFNFEILYKKVTDTIGVYEIQLTLPDALRQLQFGAVSITIPVIGIDIYTNGNFKIDVGFPNGTDFSNSLTVQVFPFLGAGGFYYAMLSQGTATNVPSHPGGQFNPVLEFGFGLSLGVGKTINVGILSAGISVTFVGILEGTVAYWVPDGDPSTTAVMFNKAPDYYSITGQIAIVGTLYGVVDFGIVKASLTVNISAGATLMWQAYDDLVLSVYAQVSCSLVVVIGGFSIFGITIEIKISLSFSASVSYTWTIPDNRTPPWASSLKEASARMLAAESVPQPIEWTSLTIHSPAQPVTIYFSPQVTVARPDGAQSPEAQFVALLTINTTATSGYSDFDYLASTLLAWAITLYYNPGATTYNPNLPVNADSESGPSLNALGALLSTPGTTINDGPQPLDYAHLGAFLQANFSGTIQGVPAGSSSQTNTIFPMIPDLVLTATGQQPIAFGSSAMVPTSYIEDIAEYFALLLVNYDVNEAAGGPLMATDSLISMSTVIFQDYFALIVKSSVSEAYQYLSAQTSTETTLGNLLNSLQSNGSFANVAKQAGRFLLHGLRLPAEFNLPEDQWAELDTQPLYQLTCQQVPLNPISGNSSVTDASTPSTTQFSASGLSVEPPYTTITFTSGALNGQSSTITAYANDLVTVSPAFTAAPAVGNAFSVLTYTAAISINGNPPPANPWYLLSTITPPVSVMAAEAQQIIQELVDTKFAPVVNVAALPNVAQQPVNYSLQRNTPWQQMSGSTPGTSFGVYPFPATLQNQLANTQLPLPRLSMLSGALGSQNTPSPIQSYNWGTLVTLSVQQIPATSGFLPSTYQVGGTDETGRNLIYNLLTQLCPGDNPDQPNPSQIAGIYLLYAPQSQNQAGLVSDSTIEPSATMLMKVNLSTASAPPSQALAAKLEAAAAEPPADSYNAMLDQYCQFLRLVWECSIVNAGGYYLYYQNSNTPPNNGLPSYLFTSGTTAQITMLIVFQPNSPVANFNNCVVLPSASIPPQNEVVFAQASNILQWNATIAAGSLAFEMTVNDPGVAYSMPASVAAGSPATARTGVVTRDDVVAALKADGINPGSREYRSALAAAGDDSIQLLSLFNLLTYKIVSGGDFLTSIQGLPVGPLVPPGNGNQSSGDQTTWNYQQGVAVYPWYNNQGQSPLCGTAQGAANQSPYAGIGGKVELEFALLDLFGNEMPVTTPMPTLTADYLYFDNLIPVAAWTGVRNSYLCTIVSGQSELQVTLAFDPSVFQDSTSSGTVWDVPRATQSLEYFQLICFQLCGPGVTITLSTTLAPDVTTTIPAAQFIDSSGLITNIINFLTAIVGGGTNPPAPPPLVLHVPITLANREANTSNIFEVVVSLAISRDSNLVDPNVNKTVPGYNPPLALLASSPVSPQVGTTLSTAVTGSGATSSSFNGGTSLSSVDGFYVGGTVTFTTGALNGQTSSITAYVGATRNITVAPAFSGAPAAGDTFALTPKATLVPFGQEFETAFPELRAATGLGSAGPLSVWAIRLGIIQQGDEGISFAIDTTKPTFFAPAPLSNTLLSRPDATHPAPVMVMPYQSGGPDQPMQAMNFAGVDLDVFGRAFLIAVDQFLSPAMAPTVRQLEPGYYLAVVSAKEALAQEISLGVTNVLEIYGSVTGSPTSSTFQAAAGLSSQDGFYVGDLVTFTSGALTGSSSTITGYVGASSQITVSPAFGQAPAAGDTFEVVPNSAALEAAQEAFTQKLLVSLGNDYNISTIVQYPATVRTTGTEEPVAPNLYGGVVQSTSAVNDSSSTTTTFKGGTALSTVDGFYIGCVITFTAGALSQQTSVVTAYTGSSREFTVAPALPAAPANGDAFAIVQPNTALSTASVSLSQSSSLLTFIFGAGAVQQAAVPMDMQFQVTHLEHDISQTGQLDGYTSSSWLTLITNNAGAWPVGNQVPVGQTTIPVPLRAYPTPPSLLQQSALPGASERPTPPSPDSLQSLRAWHYDCQYEQSFVPQDTVQANVLFNIPQNQMPRALFAANEPDLFDWLARFSYEYPMMQADLATIATGTYDQKVASYAIQRFAELVWGAAYGSAPMPTPTSPLPPPATGPWALWVTGASNPTALAAVAGAPPLTQYQYSYEIEEINPFNQPAEIRLFADQTSYPYPDIQVRIVADRVSSTTNPSTTQFSGGSILSDENDAYLKMNVLFTTGSLAGLSAEISGYAGSTRTFTVSTEFPQVPAVGDAFAVQLLAEPDVTGDSATYQYNNPNPSSILIRTLVFNSLDVMSTENAWGGIQLARNKILVEGVDTNPLFVYQTPIVRFVNVVTPILDSTDPVNIAQLQPANPVQTLEYFLCVMFNALFATSGGMNSQESTRTIRVGATYSYDIRGGLDTTGTQAAMVTVPVLLFPPFQFNLSTDMGSNCASAPDPRSFVYGLGQAIRTWYSAYNPSPSGGVFTFDISVFAGLSNTNLPVLRVRDLYLNLADIQPPLQS